MPTPKINNTRLLTEKLKYLKRLSSISGCSIENSVIIKTRKDIIEIEKQVKINGDVHPPVFHAELPLDKASNKHVKKDARETNPSRSKDR